MSNPPGTVDHTGTTCPFCSVNGACGHPTKIPPLPPWQANVWVKSIPTDN